MKKIALVLRHVGFEHLGTLQPVLTQAGYETLYRDAGLDDLRDPRIACADLLIILGGPIGVYEEDAYPFLTDEMRLLEVRLKRNHPTFGICLGAQLMARALGARVYQGSAKEIGWSLLTLTPEGKASPVRALENTPVLHWHGDTFDLPKGSALLASTPLFPNQAFSRGPAILGLQFHCECDAHEIEHWLIGHACEIAAAKLSPPELRAAARKYGEGLARAGQTMMRAWLAQIAAAELSL